MLLSHTAGGYARVLTIARGLIIGFTVVSAFSATRVYLSAVRPGRGSLIEQTAAVQPARR